MEKTESWVLYYDWDELTLTWWCHLIAPIDICVGGWRAYVRSASLREGFDKLFGYMKLYEFSPEEIRVVRGAPEPSRRLLNRLRMVD